MEMHFALGNQCFAHKIHLFQTPSYTHEDFLHGFVSELFFLLQKCCAHSRLVGQGSRRSRRTQVRQCSDITAGTKVLQMSARYICNASMKQNEKKWLILQL